MSAAEDWSRELINCTTLAIFASSSTFKEFDPSLVDVMVSSPSWEYGKTSGSGNMVVLFFSKFQTMALMFLS
jgi:hypothetical protein